MLRFVSIISLVAPLFATSEDSEMFDLSKIASPVNWTYPCLSSVVSNMPFCDTTMSFEDRANDLVDRLSVEDMAGLSVNSAKGVPSLNLPVYQWWSEALHGVAWSPGVDFNRGPIKSATMFPQVIGTGATFNRHLWKNIGAMISTEGRAMFNNVQAGLTFWTPNVNIYRDPRWGRGQETPGEDPFVNGEYAANFVSGFQGNDMKYLKASPCCKHYDAYSLENYNGTDRHHYNAVVSQQDLNDTYLIPFKYCVKKGRGSSLMCSYNAVNGVPSCANTYLLSTLARDSWGFEGYITSDCGAVNDVQSTHHYTKDTDTTVKDVFDAGMDSNCGGYTSAHTVQAVKDKVLSMDSLKKSIKNLVLVQMRLGLFDPLDATPWSKLGPSNVNTKRAQDLALQASRESMVLLKNNGALPLDKSKIKKIAVVGVHGNATNVMQGNYNGRAPFMTPIAGSIGMEVAATSFVQGCTKVDSTDMSQINAAVQSLSGADVVIVSIGIDQSIEREGHDRVTIDLPGTCQKALMQAVYKSAPSAAKVIVILTSGGSVDLSEPKGNSRVDGIMWTGYGGMFAGRAVADVLFGNYNPSGKLTQTFYSENFAMESNFFEMGMRPDGKSNPGRTYRFYSGNNVVYPFGSGLSYTSFSCVMNGQPSKTEIPLKVKNAGSRTGDVSVLVFYVDKSAGKNGVPLKQLVAFDKALGLAPGEQVSMNLQLYEEFVDSGSAQGGSFEMVGCSTQVYENDGLVL